MENTIYAKFNEDGFVSGFWQSAAYDAPAEGEDRHRIIPADAIEITQDQFNELFKFQGLRKFVDGIVIVYEPPAPGPAVPSVISSRQFFLQLAVAGISQEVEEWVASQDDPLVQIAFNKSATFRRNDAMLQQGFSGLGFTVEQVDEFFMDAARL